jgi:hypothetical protein
MTQDKKLLINALAFGQFHILCNLLENTCKDNEYRHKRLKVTGTISGTAKLTGISC